MAFNLLLRCSFAALVGTAAAASATPSPESRQLGAGGCQASTFAGALPANARLERVDAVPAGGTYGEGADDLNYPVPPTDLPELCAVTVAVASSPTSAFRFGLFLPAPAAAWNARFLAVGNGGFGGGVNWPDMGAGARLGFAAASTDTGHRSAGGDLAWALRAPEARADWGWRAVHGSVALAKALTAAYYGRPPAYAYYSGCSTGGRQGLKELQLSPASFDGVLVGAPAWYTSHLNPWVAAAATFNWPADAPGHIGADRFAGLADAVAAQCDALDGVADGIVSLPARCAVDYGALECEANASSSAAAAACLTGAQLETMRKVYGDWRTDGGEFLYPGLLPGSEAMWDAVLNYSDASPYGIGYARYFLYDDAGFGLGDFNASAAARADATDPGNATAGAYDLTAFRDRGGRLVLYHGAADGLVPTKGSELYWERAVAATEGGDAAAARRWFRYFAVPGMQHCALTACGAPWAFGGASQAAALGPAARPVPGLADARHDVLLALVDWVERGVPVDSVVASTWNTPDDPASGLLRQRPICPHPQMARWDGEGDVDDAASWSCGYVNSVIFPPS
ncbi:Tannase/feruloyl esterase [Xylariomycetidae sp. FL0641]|nr:Tannase/feruloyl esterase [Xylariomycetidae sp. FL0641]